MSSIATNRAVVEAPGAAGYGAAHAPRFDALDPVAVHGEFLRLATAVGLSGVRVLDAGAGSGRDARWFAGRGAQVTAVEPGADLFAHGSARGGGPRWLRDALPDLASLREGARFDLIWCSAVLAHLSPADQDRALARFAGLLAPGGRVFMSLRDGPYPAGRTSYPCDPDRLSSLARRLGLLVLRRRRTPSAQQANRERGVEWTKLLFAMRIRR
ncbi:MAG: methyltransferase domain-containing protein [Alphaproteobacteria bacterium]|nr:methyltransferase domain-containing protein [Alphaproteobacteria bacterium]